MAIELIRLDTDPQPLRDAGDRASDVHAYFLRGVGPAMSKKAIKDVAISFGLPDRGELLDGLPVISHDIDPVESTDADDALGEMTRGAYIYVRTGRGGGGGSAVVTSYSSDSESIPSSFSYPVFAQLPGSGQWYRQDVSRYRPLTYRSYTGAIEGVAFDEETATQDLNRNAGKLRRISTIPYVLTGFRVFNDPNIGWRYHIRFATRGTTPAHPGSLAAPGDLGNQVTVPALSYLDEFGVLPSGPVDPPVVAVVTAEALYEEMDQAELAWVQGL